MLNESIEILSRGLSKVALFFPLSDEEHFLNGGPTIGGEETKVVGRKIFIFVNGDKRKSQGIKRES